jgi:hypothetical protein
MKVAHLLTSDIMDGDAPNRGKAEPWWRELEKAIQQFAEFKDKSFKLEEQHKVYEVDSNWVRANLSVVFGLGGHGLVHEFIPMDEIWVAKQHNEWNVEDFRVTRPLVKEEEFDSIVLHEITEFKLMAKGLSFYNSHSKANDAEEGKFSI